MCLFLAVLGLPCCVGFSLAVESRSYSLVVGHGLFIAVASLVSEHRLSGIRGFSSYIFWALDCRLNSSGLWA